jgi:hypothetical protein
MTAADIKGKIARALDQYTAHPFAITFALLLPALAWFVVVIGGLELLRGGPLPADPAQSFNDGAGAGLLIGTVATVAGHAVLYLIARRRRAK